ncbi:MAG TPA: hypothetical protein VFK11_00740 [Candidatus Saccharimonadales bacterium]|nr:hypothetical protein [Candidatus Saccharimonadales bacterium]
MNTYPGISREKEPSVSKQDRKIASRIAARALYQFEQGNYAFMVRGGRLGLLDTMHPPEVYDLVAERLRDSADEAEISVIRVNATSVVPGKGVTKMPASDVILAKSIGGFTRYPSPHPSEAPQQYLGNNAFGSVARVAPFSFELMHPHSPEPTPAPTA